MTMTDNEVEQAVLDDLDRIRELLWMLLRVQTALARQQLANVPRSELKAVVQAAEEVIAR